MANKVEGLNGTRSTYMYEHIEIVEIDGVHMVRRLKDKKSLDSIHQRKKFEKGTINDNAARANQGIKTQL